ncbi:hypothetical protein ABKA04_000464 [Annulohypoxylon sp. FPYF3050]
MHHSRRKSGHASTNSSTTDVRKAVTTSDLSKPRRPQTLTRKSTPQTVQKLGKNPKDREREWEEERWFDDERESFPQFCMTCEKQFTPQDEKFLYCSEACRERDQITSFRTPRYHPTRLAVSLVASYFANQQPIHKRRLGLEVIKYKASEPDFTRGRKCDMAIHPQRRY